MSELTNDSPEMLARRELLRRAAWLLGGAVSAPAALAILQGCSARDAAPGAAPPALKFLAAGEFAVVEEIADIMIPKTSTSGAKDVGIGAFIDTLLADVYDAPARERFRQGAAAFEIAAAVQGTPFLELDRNARVAHVRAALESALAGQGTDHHADKPFILTTRELTLLGFYTSRVGITENMEYVAVPGAFHGCVPVAQLAKPVYWE